jgi:hypothetical protein
MDTYSETVFRLHVERVHVLRPPDRVRTFPFNDTVAALDYARALNAEATTKGLPYLYRVTTVRVGL